MTVSTLTTSIKGLDRNNMLTSTPLKFKMLGNSGNLLVSYMHDCSQKCLVSPGLFGRSRDRHVFSSTIHLLKKSLIRPPICRKYSFKLSFISQGIPNLSCSNIYPGKQKDFSSTANPSEPIFAKEIAQAKPALNLTKYTLILKSNTLLTGHFDFVKKYNIFSFFVSS